MENYVLTFGALSASIHTPNRVFGLSGVGKTKFINTVTGSTLAVSNTIDSVTENSTSTDIPILDIGQARIQLVDMPGFGDTRDDDEVKVFRNIAEWLSVSFREGKKVSGIIYLRSIQEARVLRAETKLMQMVKDLCGDDNLNHVVLVTNRWCLDAEQEEEEREQQIVSDPTRFGTSRLKSVQVRRLKNKYTKEDAQGIVEIFENTPSITLQIQQEMQDAGRSFDKTTAASRIDVDLHVRSNELAKEIERNESRLQSMHAEIVQRQCDGGGGGCVIM
ncbi:unnamed protein product [Rhizoctonia solani]|uniref:G domain-containing protein n=1 Tax=Rhizoctonia solani TaxID=456999 RepID=A0A8H3HLU7_9AGAM|nr:unnamed protein product [Rhizoctonia solani]